MYELDSTRQNATRVDSVERAGEMRHRPDSDVEFLSNLIRGIEVDTAEMRCMNRAVLSRSK